MLAERQREIVPLMFAHRLMGISLLFTGDVAESRIHFNRAISLYDPAQHRPLAMRFGHDNKVAVSSLGSIARWVLGYPEAAHADIERAIKDARDIGQAGTLMYALSMTLYTIVFCGNYAAANKQSNEVSSLADEKGAPLWKAYGILFQGFLLAITGEASNAIQMINTGMVSYRSTGSTAFMPWYLSNLAMAYAEVGQFEDAWSCIDQAMMTAERTKERWSDAEVHRVAGEIALKLPEPDATKAEGSFELALAVAREQQAKSWELRAAMSMARLWRDQGKRHQAHDLLAPVYGWFTEGFDTLDLKEAKSLLEQLKA